MSCLRSSGWALLANLTMTSCDRKPPRAGAKVLSADRYIPLVKGVVHSCPPHSATVAAVMLSPSTHGSKCVYNVPMASDMSPVTLGLDPDFALARNRQHLAGFRRHTVGPMPMQEFTDTFLPDSSPDRTGCLSGENAFNLVPSEADWTADITNPLVSAVVYATPSPKTSNTVDRSLSSTDGHMTSPAALVSSLKRLLPAVCILVDSAT